MFKHYNFSFSSQKSKKKNLKFIWITAALIVIILGIFSWFNLKQNKVSYPFAYLSTQKIDHQNAQAQVDPKVYEFGIKIEKIEMIAPIVKEVDGEDKNAYNKALLNGVAHYAGTSLPGKGGNIFIFGHSSSNYGRGAYAKIFARLGELAKGDQIIVFVNNKEYKYEVFDKSVVEKEETSVLNKTKKEQLTLMTCWPIGSNEKRLIIKASVQK